jgi:inner membrane protein
MPTILTHPAVPLTIAWGLGREVISTRLLAVGVIASVVPDLDVLAFRFGIPYAAEFGHRGFSHSLLLALIIAVVGASLVRPLHTTLKRAFWFLFVSMASHGILDALTNGGLGIAFLWPFSGERFFAPFQPIEVAPLGLSRFLSLKGVAVLWSEILWVWMPFSGVAAIAVVFRRHRALALLSSHRYLHNFIPKK